MHGLGAFNAVGAGDKCTGHMLNELLGTLHKMTPLHLGAHIQPLLLLASAHTRSQT